jgi:hypothetical protein
MCMLNQLSVVHVFHKPYTRNITLQTHQSPINHCSAAFDHNSRKTSVFRRPRRSQHLQRWEPLPIEVLVEAIGGDQRVKLYEDAVLVLCSVDPTPLAPIKTPIRAYIKADQSPKDTRLANFEGLQSTTSGWHNNWWDWGNCADWLTTQIGVDQAKRLRPDDERNCMEAVVKRGTWRCASRACGGRRRRRSGRSRRRSCGWARPARTPAVSSLPANTPRERMLEVTKPYTIHEQQRYRTLEGLVWY